MPDQHLDAELQRDLEAYLTTINSRPLPRGIQEMTVTTLVHRRNVLRATLLSSAAVLGAAAITGVALAHGSGLGPKPGPVPAASASTSASAAPSPSAAPSNSPSPAPTATATPQPTVAPTATASADPRPVETSPAVHVSFRYPQTWRVGECSTVGQTPNTRYIVLSPDGTPVSCPTAAADTGWAGTVGNSAVPPTSLSPGVLSNLSSRPATVNDFRGTRYQYTQAQGPDMGTTTVQYDVTAHGRQYDFTLNVKGPRTQGDLTAAFDQLVASAVLLP